MKTFRTGGPSSAVGGFSLFEMLVSLAVLLVGMALASQILLESQTRIAHSSRRALDPVGELAMKQVMADVRAGGAIAHDDYEWSWTPLVILDHPAGAVRYEKQGNELLRSVSGREVDGKRTVLRGVRVWRWRVRRDVPLPLVEIELGFQETARLGRLTSGGTREAASPSTETLRFAASPRQAGGREGW